MGCRHPNGPIEREANDCGNAMGEPDEVPPRRSDTNVIQVPAIP